MVYCWTKHFSPPAATNPGLRAHKHQREFPLPLDHFVTTVRERIRNVTKSMIGASLSEPYTSGTALQKCVCNICACLLACLLACLRPYNINFKCTFKYFPKIECPCAPIASIGTRWRAMLSCCQSAALATVAGTAQVQDAWHLLFYLSQEGHPMSEG